MLRAGCLAATAAVLLLAATPAGAASFDCAGAKAADEKAVCGDCDLAQLDVKMATLFTVATRLVGMGQRNAMQDDQRAFLQRRGECGGDAACLTGAYRARIGQLESAMEAIYSRGPF